MPAQPQSSGLVDLYRLFVFRGAVGVGAPLFQDQTDTINLELLKARPLPSGAIGVLYPPRTAAG